MRLEWKLTTFLVLFVSINYTICRRRNMEDLNDETNAAVRTAGKRTFFVGNYFLLPTLATIGIKFFLLLPVFLSKVALLSVMSFISSKLHFLLWIITGIRNYFLGKIPKWEGDNINVEVEYVYPQPSASPVNYIDEYDVHYQSSDVSVAAAKEGITSNKIKGKKIDVRQKENQNNFKNEQITIKQPEIMKCYWTKEHLKIDLSSRKMRSIYIIDTSRKMLDKSEMQKKL